MPYRKFRFFFCIASLLVSGVSHSRPAKGADAERPATFAGTWLLDEKASIDPLEKETTRRPSPAKIAANPREGPRGVDQQEDLPLEASGDVRLVAIVDEGSRLRLDYVSGRKRLFFLDGEERELDDGDGPAKVIARKSGEGRITVSSRWPRSKGLTESWELLSNPPRILVTGKVKGRRSFTYRRLYVPAPPSPPPTAPSAASGSANQPRETSTASAPVSAPAIPVPRATLSECSIRPAKGTSSSDLVRQARITQADAAARATTFMAPAKPSSVISSDVEVYEGCLVWSFVMRFAEKKGVQEVMVDAGDGQVVFSEFEAAK